MARHVVPASILQNLIELALRSRLNVEELFGEAGIDADIIGKPDALVDVAQIDRLFGLAFTRVSDPWFWLHAGLSNQYSSLDLVGRLMASSSTLRDAVLELLRFKDLIAPYLHFEFIEDGGLAMLSWTPDGSMAFAETRAHDDLVAAMVFSIGRSLAGGDIGLRRLQLRHAAPEDPAEYGRVFGPVAIAFASPRNEVWFDAAMLDRRLSTAFPRYRERVEQQAAEQLSRLVRGQSVADQVMARIARRLGEQAIGIEEVAREFNMTARTLQRRLREEDATYGDLRDRVRHRLACELLGDPAIDMDSLAQRLGFADTANFYHAFRRWEGSTPGAYRRARLNPSGDGSR